MGPDEGGRKMLTDLLGFTIDKSKFLNNVSTGPKYIVLTRNSDIDNCVSLNEVSPFLIKKVIDNVCGGEVDQCKKLRNGSILIKTKNLTQAQKLIQLTSFSPLINITASEHNSLNHTKGVIYCNDLRGINEDIILQELKDQKAVKIEKIMKKVDNALMETGLIVITFADLSLPDSIQIGYEKIRVRVYIPRPMKCNNCWLYGHTSKFWKNTKTCANCSKEHHTDALTGEKCTNNKSCINCILHKCSNTNHATFENICPIFLKEKEIQAIISLEKTSRNAAIAIFNQRHPDNKHSYASVTGPSTVAAPPKNHSTSPKDFITSPKPVHPPTFKTPLDYSDLTNCKKDAPATTSKYPTSKITSILPKNISKRTRYQLKKIAALSESKNSPFLGSGDSSDNAAMDFDIT